MLMKVLELWCAQSDVSMSPALLKDELTKSNCCGAGNKLECIIGNLVSHIRKAVSHPAESAACYNVFD